MPFVTLLARFLVREEATSVRNSKPFPFQLPFSAFSLSVLHRSSLFQPLFRRLFISFPPFHAVMNVPLFLSRSRFASVSLFLALSFPTPVPPTLPFTSRLWILLSNTYVARAATRLDVCACVVACVQCARTRACARRVHARWQRTQANGKARVLISIFDASTHAMGRDTTTRPFLSAAVLREREHGR